MEELLKLFEERPELGHEVEVMWARGASAQEIAEALSKNGVKAEQSEVEEMLSLLQEKRAKVIGDGEKVDREQLRRVAGGGQGLDCSKADDCDYSFKSEFYWGRERCRFDYLCDEYLQ